MTELTESTQEPEPSDAEIREGAFQLVRELASLPIPTFSVDEARRFTGPLTGAILPEVFSELSRAGEIELVGRGVGGDNSGLIKWRATDKLQRPLGRGAW